MTDQTLRTLEREWSIDPSDLERGLGLVSAYLRSGEPHLALRTLGALSPPIDFLRPLVDRAAAELERQVRQLSCDAVLVEGTAGMHMTVHATGGSPTTCAAVELWDQRDDDPDHPPRQHQLLIVGVDTGAVLQRVEVDDHWVEPWDVNGPRMIASVAFSASSCFVLNSAFEVVEVPLAGDRVVYRSPRLLTPDFCPQLSVTADGGTLLLTVTLEEVLEEQHYAQLAPDVFFRGGCAQMTYAFDWPSRRRLGQWPGSVTLDAEHRHALVERHEDDHDDIEDSSRSFAALWLRTPVTTHDPAGLGCEACEWLPNSARFVRRASPHRLWPNMAPGNAAHPCCPQFALARDDRTFGVRIRAQEFMPLRGATHASWLPDGSGALVIVGEDVPRLERWK